MRLRASCDGCVETRIVEVNLELGLAHSVVGANQPLLEIPNRTIGKWYGGLRPPAQLRSIPPEQSIFEVERHLAKSHCCEPKEAIEIILGIGVDISDCHVACPEITFFE
jgi:hypothetical protein